MNDWTLGRVFNGAAEDLVGKRRGVPFAKKDVPHNIHDRVDIGPVEVGVRDTSGSPLQVNEKRGDGIGNCRAPWHEKCGFDPASVNPVDLQRYSVKSEVSPRATSTK